MKKQILVSTIIVLLAFCGCNKNPLDITPDGRITLQEVFANEDLTGAYLNTIYESIQWYGTAYHYWTMLAGFSDEAHDNDAPQNSDRPVVQWYLGNLSPTNNPLDPQPRYATNNQSYYDKNWAGIRRANVFLANIDDAAIVDPNLKARMRAEAKTLRAFFYLELIKMYGGMPVVDKPFDETFRYEELTRASFDECAQFIAKDCDEAIAEPAFPLRIVNEADRGRFSKAVAYAVKSQALLFGASPLWNEANDNQRWTKAAQAAKNAIDDLTDGGFTLFPDYEAYFYGRSDLSPNPSDRETIFEIKGHKAAHSFSKLLFLMHSIPALRPEKAGSSPSQELVDAYDMANGQAPILGYRDADHLDPIINPASGYDDADPYKDRDPRFYATIWYNNAYYGLINGQEHYIESYLGGADGISSISQRTHNGYYLRKFKDPTVLDNASGSALFKKYRLAELYLNYAEAQNEAFGPNSDVYEAVNAVRGRVDMPGLPEGLTQEEMRVRIRKERQVELAFEEHRFWDTRRWKTLDQTDKLTTGMEWTKHPDGTFTNRRIVVGRRSAWEDRFLIFPLSVTELSKLPGFYQNPGW